MGPEMARVLCSGSFICDFIAADLPRIGDPGDLVYAPDGIRLHPGGHAANVAIDLAQLGRPDTAVAGGVGDDVLGRFLIEELEKRGLAVFPEVMPEAHTAKNLALIIQGEDRRFIAELSANSLLTPDHVLGTLKDVNPEVFYLGTVGGLKHIDGKIDSILTKAKKEGTTTMVDVIRPYEGGWDALRDSLGLVDVFHCNAFESAALTGEDDPAKASSFLARKGVGITLITMGSEGLVAASGNHRFRVPVFGVETVDPTGAGDAFCAGVIDALLEIGVDSIDFEHLPVDNLKSLLLRGSAAGASCVTAVGATTAVLKGAVDKLIEEQGERIWAETLNP